jgi:hypothetical protein
MLFFPCLAADGVIRISPGFHSQGDLCRMDLQKCPLSKNSGDLIFSGRIRR